MTLGLSLTMCQEGESWAQTLAEAKPFTLPASPVASHLEPPLALGSVWCLHPSAPLILSYTRLYTLHRHGS